MTLLVLALIALSLSVFNLYYPHKSFTVFGNIQIDLPMASQALVGVFLVVYGIQMIRSNMHKKTGYFILVLVFIGAMLYLWPHTT